MVLLSLISLYFYNDPHDNIENGHDDFLIFFLPVDFKPGMEKSSFKQHPLIIASYREALWS